MMGALDWRDRRLIVATSKTKRSADVIAFLEDLDHHYGPKPRPPIRPMPKTRRHRTRQRADSYQQGDQGRARGARHWSSVAWLPKYAPELNDIENLDRAVHKAVEALNVERKPNPLAKQRISA